MHSQGGQGAGLERRPNGLRGKQLAREVGVARLVDGQRGERPADPANSHPDTRCSMRVTHWMIPMLVTAAPTVAAQQVVEMRQVFASDSLVVGRSAQVSPDGRWVVLTRSEGTLGGSLWIASTSGGAPARLTSDGHRDTEPTWFRTGNGIAFLSTRPNRNGSRSPYLMTLAIDPQTGRPTGTPRQVSTEPVSLEFAASPDGRSLAYATVGTTPQLKLVPVNGGTARVIASAVDLFGPPVFSPDGRELYYSDRRAGNGGPCSGVDCRYTLRRVPVGGRTATVVAEQGNPVAAFPADPTRYLLHFVGTSATDRRWELRAMGGEVLGSFAPPPGSRTPVPTGDGAGLMVVRNETENSIRIAPVAGGTIQTLITSRDHGLEDWMPNSSAILTHRPDGSRGRQMVLEVLPLTGGEPRRQTLPPGVTESVWHTSVGDWFIHQSPSPDGLQAINLATGQARKIPGVPIQQTLLGTRRSRGDGQRILYAERRGDQVEIRSTDPETGAARILRTFSAASLPRGLHVHGSRLAWFEARSDSTDLMLTTGPTGSPRRVVTYPTGQIGSDPWEQLAWSTQGDRLAVCRARSATDRRAFITILDISGPAGARAASQDLDLPGWTPCWLTQWLPDDSGLLTLSVRPGTNKPDILHVPLPGGAAPRAITNDETNEVWGFRVSPDGRSVAYLVNLPATRSTVHVADFKPLLRGRQ